MIEKLIKRYILLMAECVFHTMQTCSFGANQDLAPQDYIKSSQIPTQYNSIFCFVQAHLQSLH